jgi:hypothetical protein
MGSKGKLAMTAMLALLVALVLSACGGGGSEDSTGSADTAVAEAETDSGGETTSPPDSSQSGDGGDSGSDSPDGDGSGAPDGASDGAGGSSGDGEAPDSGGSDGGQGAASDGGKSNGNKSNGKSKGGGSKGGSQKGGAPRQSQQERNLEGITEFGSEASPDESEEARGALEAYLKSFGKQDWQAVCGMFAAPAIAKLKQLSEGIPQYKGKNCVELFSSGALPPMNPNITIETLSSFRIEGNVGYAFYEGGKLVMLMQKEGGSWKVNGVQPEPVPGS